MPAISSIPTTSRIGHVGRGGLDSSADGVWHFENNAGTKVALPIASGGSGALDIFPAMMIDFAVNGANPADATPYFFGTLSFQTWADNGAWLDVRAFIAPVKMRIKAAYINFSSFGVAGSNEPSSIAIRVNNTTDTTIFSNNIILGAASQSFVANAGLPLSLAAGDKFCLKWTTPTWGTNPTVIYCSGSLYLEAVI